MSTSPRSAQPAALAVFRNRAFTLLWTAQLISTMGSGLSALAASILVYRLTGSALSVGLMLMATALPSVFVGLIAGVFVDRFDRKRIMIAADLVRALLACSIPFLLPYGVAWLYVMVVLASAVGQFFGPAQASLLAEVASEEELVAANSMMTISAIGATTIGYAAAGLISSQFSVAWAFYLDALSFVISAGCITFLHGTWLPVEEETTLMAVRHNLRAGLQYVVETPILRSLFLLYVPVFISFGFHHALVLPFARRVLHASEFDYSMLEGLFTLSFVVGCLLMAGWAGRLYEGQWTVLSFIGIGIAGLCFALSPTMLPALVLIVVVGMLNAPAYIARQLVIQRHTPRELRGRVYSAFFVTRDLAFLVGMAAAGLADLYDVRLLIIAESIVVLVCGVGALVLPGLRQPAAEWRRAVHMLRRAQAAPGLGLGRVARPADLDQIAIHLPELAHVDPTARAQLTERARVYDARAGTVIVRQGDAGDAAYFILAGRAVAAREDDGANRLLEVLQAGDFFGEIAALSSVARTANVIAEQPTTVLQVPAATLRQLMSDTRLNRLFLSKMTARMLRMNMIDVPRLAGLDQQALRELRTLDPGLADPQAVVAA